jgi:hypothetical protein
MVMASFTFFASLSAKRASDLMRKYAKAGTPIIAAIKTTSKIIFI